ncbi:DUF933 domain-containing protein, partial [Colwellia sp. MB02u-12]|uniref:DUF933 domain-containing protein n=1 Tax=Colwellia sp. MB02u-12 TaxID=2759827 RepID=UPI0015F5EF83
AEVVAYDDFIEFNAVSCANEAGKWLVDGIEYLVKDGDVLHFSFLVEFLMSNV